MGSIAGPNVKGNLRSGRGTGKDGGQCGQNLKGSMIMVPPGAGSNSGTTDVSGSDGTNGPVLPKGSGTLLFGSGESSLIPAQNFSPIWIPSAAPDAAPAARPNPNPAGPPASPPKK